MHTKVVEEGASHRRGCVLEGERERWESQRMTGMIVCGILLSFSFSFSRASRSRTFSFRSLSSDCSLLF